MIMSLTTHGLDDNGHLVQRTFSIFTDVIVVV